jgi:membrane protein DedA with SNARE-associated domain
MHWRVLTGAALLVGVIAFMALLVQHDASGRAPDADASIRHVLTQHSYLAGFALIYVEESGLPLFIPGDAFLLYVGHRLPENAVILLAAWLGFTLAVTLGATNLYLVSRRYGRRLLEHRLARLLHLTPARMDRAERSFARWGPWALIFGRHIPGLRVPLTVAAGILLLPYRVFAISVAVSSAAWAAIFLSIGSLFGDGLERSIRGSPALYAGAVAGVLVVMAGIVAVRHLISRRKNVDLFV